MTIDEAIALMGTSAVESRARLKVRYRRLAVLHHPDRNGNSPASYAAFTRINHAYHLLDQLLARQDGGVLGMCTGCGERPARARGLDRNPYCRDCLVYAGGRRLLPAPPTVIASCAFAAVAEGVALLALVVFLISGAPRYGVAALVFAGAGIVSLAISAVLIGRVAPKHVLARSPRRMPVGGSRRPVA
ncbi:MAG: J domain-containing protein [Phycisphaerales bacterium]|nr:J domain-containing protein [Phycisphaerales bacterium]